MQSYGHIAAKRDYDFLEMRRFMERHAITGFTMNPHFPVNTLLAMRGAVAAAALGCAPAYVEAVFAGLWERGLKLDDPAVWQSVVEEVGLPAAELAEAVADPAVKAQLAANTEMALARGVFGIPSFFLGKEMWFGKDRLRDVVEAAQ
jgi:2-hydroxychromene-2-carboxylate isomerase